MKKLLYKIAILVLIFSFTAEISIAIWDNYRTEYAIKDNEDSSKEEKKEKDQTEKDKLIFSSIPQLFTVDIKRDFYTFSENPLSAFKIVPEIPPKQV